MPLNLGFRVVLGLGFRVVLGLGFRVVLGFGFWVVLGLGFRERSKIEIPNFARNTQLEKLSSQGVETSKHPVLKNIPS